MTWWHDDIFGHPQALWPGTASWPLHKDHSGPAEVLNIIKVDGVGPPDNRPSTDNLNHFVKKNGLVTCDTWQVTCDMWNIAVTAWEWRFDKDIFTNYDQLKQLLNQWINYKSIYRTALATRDQIRAHIWVWEPIWALLWVKGQGWI